MSVSFPVAPSKRDQPALAPEKKKRTPTSVRSTLLAAVDCGEDVPDPIGAAELVAEVVGDSGRVVAPGVAHETTTSAVRRRGRIRRCYPCLGPVWS